MRIEKLIEPIQEHYQLSWTQGDGGMYGGYHVKLLDVLRKHRIFGKMLCFEDLNSLRRIRNRVNKDHYKRDPILPSDLVSHLEDFTRNASVLTRVLKQVSDAVLMVYKGPEAAQQAQCERAKADTATTRLGTFDSLDDLPIDDFDSTTDDKPDDEPDDDQSLGGFSDYDWDDEASGISNPAGITSSIIWSEEHDMSNRSNTPSDEEAASDHDVSAPKPDTAGSDTGRSPSPSSSSAKSAEEGENASNCYGTDIYQVDAGEPDWLSDKSDGSSLYLDDDFSDPRDPGMWTSWAEPPSADAASDTA